MTNNLHEDYIMGVDLGRQLDHFAIVVLHRQMVVSDDDDPRHSVVFLSQIELGTPYTEIIEYVAQLVDSHELRGMVNIAVDRTGVGTGVMDFWMNNDILAPITWQITITSGRNIRRDGTSFFVPKADLVASSQILMQTGKILMHPQLPGCGNLLQELYSFSMKVTNLGHKKMEGDKTAHDDLCMALCCACFLSSQLSIEESSLLVSGSSMVPYPITRSAHLNQGRMIPKIERAVQYPEIIVTKNTMA